MNKPFFYTATAIILLTAASGNAYCQAVMTMTTFEKQVQISLGGSGKITIDWGDGKRKNYKLTAQEYYEYIYSDTSAHTITIIGKNIKEINCGNNQLTNLEVSKNTVLKELTCWNNQLASLDVRKNILLEVLNCSNNPFDSLDISKNEALIFLSCDNNQLKSLDISKNIKLMFLACGRNQLTHLDVSKNIVLWDLWCNKNQLTDLDVSKNIALGGHLNCSNNNFSENALNALFETLHDKAIEYKVISIFENPGTENCNKTIAEKKGWEVIDKEKSY